MFFGNEHGEGAGVEHGGKVGAVLVFNVLEDV
jgi:hypothetical protein